MKRIYRDHSDRVPALDEPKLEISSLIDVCFLMLIYFLVTTTIQPREQDLKSNVPVPISDDIVSLPPMMIEIRENGEVVTNPGDAAETLDADISSRSLPELETRLQMLSTWSASGQGPSVLLKIHDKVRQQRYIDVLNCLAGVGVSDVAILDESF